METVKSKDGTTIAYEKVGQGPVIILVDAVMSDHTNQNKLAALLAPHFTVITYDRRGRGQSGNRLPYAVAREVEDIEAVVDAVGGSAMLFGSSSGAALALAASSALGGKVTKQVLFEPPFVVDDSFAPVAEGLGNQIVGLAAAGKRNEAVRLFFSQTMRIPAFGIFMMQLMPGWSKMKAMVDTAHHDLAILHGTQVGKPLPADRWTGVTARTLVLTGEKSEAFFHSGAKALIALLPGAEHRILPGVHHGTPFMSPQNVVGVIEEFFAA